MTYEQLEEKIVEALATLTADQVDVLVMPETESEVEKAYKHARITVGYSGSEFSAGRSISTVIQDEDCSVALLIECRKLRGTNGIYHLLTRTKNLILNGQFAESNKVLLKDQKPFKPESINDDVIRWIQVFKCPGLAISDESYNTETPIAEVSFQNNNEA